MLLFMHGTDVYRLRQAVRDLIVDARAQYGTGLRIVALDLEVEGASDELEREIKYPSFFGERKYIVVTNAANSAMSDILGRFPLQSLDDMALVALQDTRLKHTDTKTLKELKKVANTTTELVPLTGHALTDWIVNYCKERNTAIEPDSVTLLTRRVGTDASLLALELEKLCSYARGSPIGADMIRLLTAQRMERDEWELANALSALDKRAAITALWRKLQEGTPEQMLIGSLAAGLRNLIIIKDFITRKQSSAGIAKLSGLHPFVISKTLRGAQSADSQRLKNAHVALARLDRDSKDGLADATDGMFSVILSL